MSKTLSFLVNPTLSSKQIVTEFRDRRGEVFAFAPGTVVELGEEAAAGIALLYPGLLIPKVVEAPKAEIDPGESAPGEPKPEKGGKKGPGEGAPKVVTKGE